MRQGGFSPVILILVLALVSVGAAYFYGNKQGKLSNVTQASPSLSIESRACTQDAMQCPDGSYVGRTGPNCEFAPCSVNNSSEWRTYSTKEYSINIPPGWSFDQKSESGHVGIHPPALSRQPEDETFLLIMPMTSLLNESCEETDYCVKFKKEIKVDGHQGWYYVVESIPGKVIRVFIDSGETPRRYYSLEYIFDQSKEQEMVDIFDQMLYSMKFEQ